MRVVLAFLVNTFFNFIIGILAAKFLGPEQFGRFAMALAVGMVIQTAVFDWLRLTAVRFYSERSRIETPELRATLDITFMILAVILAISAAGFILSGVQFSLSDELIGLAVTASITNGLFDFSTALVRARFQDRLYSRLILGKNILAFVFTAGGAFLFGSAEVALIGVCISMGGTVLIAHRALMDKGATPSLASRNLAAEYARFALPIVAANVLYLTIPLLNRALVTSIYGFAETGQYSLAYDIGTRVVAAIGSALDVLLFQIAVRADEMHGAERAKGQVAHNMAIVFAVMLPACVGLWLVLPSLEQIIVPADFRGPFRQYLGLLLPGLFCFGLISFAINPIFQIGKKTLPLIAAAAIACLANLGIIAFLPQGGDASGLASAQAGAMGCGMLALLVFAAFTKPHWPSLRDISDLAVSTAAMFSVLMPMRSWTPGVITLVLQVVAGGLIYVAFVAMLDTAGLRTLAKAALDARRRRQTQPGLQVASAGR